MQARLAADRRVAAASTRINGQALIDPGDGALPIRAQALSLPDAGRPRLNDIYLAEGRLPRDASAGEVVVVAGFAQARGLSPGDRIDVTMNGAPPPAAHRRAGPRGRVTATRPRPANWCLTTPASRCSGCRRTALAAAYDMRGTFNEALLALDRGATPKAVIDTADRLLVAHGAAGGYALAHLPSNRFVTKEIRGLEATAATVPPIFLGVAAFLMYIVPARIVEAERAQIGLLKAFGAFGYHGAEVGWHYLKMVLVIALAGAVAGSAAGIWAGHAMALFYQGYFKFPFPRLHARPGKLCHRLHDQHTGCGGRRSGRSGGDPPRADPDPGGGDAAAGAARLQPAPSTRAAPLRRWLDQSSRMVLRRINRYQGRMLSSVTGIAAGMALSASTLTVFSGFNAAVDLSFNVMKTAPT